MAISRGGTALTAGMAGDPIGGMAAGAGMLSGAGVVGIIATAVAAIGMGAKKLADKEVDRQQQVGRGR